MKHFGFLALLYTIIISFTACSAQGVKEVNSSEVEAILSGNNKIVILDVRTPGEFAQGHLKGALNYDLHQAGTLDQINQLDKNATYLVYCRTRNRSGVVVKSMGQNGFKNIIQMTDGIVGWNSNHLPLEK